jgi:hypothetical protein
LTERALLVVLAADAAVAAAVAMAELAVNLIVVRQILLELQGSLLPTQAGVLARIRTRTAEGRLTRYLTERALLVVLAADAAVAVAVAVLAAVLLIRTIRRGIRGLGTFRNSAVRGERLKRANARK